MQSRGLPPVILCLALVAFTITSIQVDDTGRVGFQGEQDQFLDRPFIAQSLENGDQLWSVEIYQSSGVPNMQRLAVADVNGDGNKEIIVSMDNSRTLCISGAGQILWVKGSSIYGIPMICNVDADDAKEIILIRPNSILCLKGSNGSTLWASYSYGSVCAAGDVDDDGKAELFTQNSENSLMCLSGRTGLARWKLAGPFLRENPIIVDNIRTGQHILLSSYLNGSLACIYAVNGSIAWISPITSSRANPIAAIDIDADGSQEIIMNATGSLHCLDSTNGMIMWSRSNFNATMKAALIADFDKDGSLDLVGVHFLTSINARIQCDDLISGQEKWSCNMGVYDLYSAQAADINNDGFAEVCITDFRYLGGTYSEGAILALSGKNGSIVCGYPKEVVKYGIMGYSYGGYESPIITDINDDGRLEILSYYIFYDGWGNHFNIICASYSGDLWRQPLPHPCSNGSPLRTNCFIDSDSDGVPDDLEESIGLNMKLNDTDGDGFLDGNEINAGTNPFDPGDPGYFIPTISIPYANPATGNQSTSFRFSVTYADADNKAPSYVRLIINKTTRAMQKLSPTDNNFTDGCAYYHDIQLDAGFYSWIIIASDGRFVINSLNYSLEVLNLSPVANLTAQPNTMIEGGLVQFTDLSVDQDGSITSWEWNFGDGSANSTLKNPLHTYETVGNYTVTLMIMDDDGAMDMCQKFDYINVVLNLAPVASFTAARRNVTEGTSVQFSDTSADPDGTIVAWEWNFGDGNQNSTEQDPVHQFTRNGTYTITLTVVDDDGNAATGRNSGYITVLNVLPTVTLTTNVTIIYVGQSIVLNCMWTGGNDPSTVSWPGASQSNSSMIILTFWIPGNITIRCNVVDTDGDEASASLVIQVLSTESYPGPSLDNLITVSLVLGCCFATVALSLSIKAIILKKKARNPDLS